MMHLVPGARASSRHFSPSRVKKVIARAFSTADDLRLQKSFYGSKTEQQLLGHSLRTAFVNFVRFRTDEARDFCKLLGDAGLNSEHISPGDKEKGVANLYSDLQNPLLKKYGFDHVAFTAGANHAVQETMKAFQSEKFKKYCGGDGADCEESDLLRATLGSSPLESIYFSIKNSRTNHLMKYSPLSAHLRSINTHIQTIEMMTVQKFTEDRFAEFFSNTTAENHAINVREIRSELETVEMWLDVLEKLTRVTDSIARIYLEDEKDSSDFMDLYHIRSYFENRREFVMSHPIILNLFQLMDYPAKEGDIFYNLMNEVSMMKAIKMHSESNGSPLLLSSYYGNKNQDLKKKQIFIPSLPYIAGSVIASVNLIVVCESSDCNPDKNYIYWNFEGCLTDEEINWKTKRMQLVR